MTADTSTHTRTQPDNDHVTPTVIREPGTGRFVAGAPSPNPRGRPRKGETLAERLVREDERMASRAIKARNKRLLKLDQTGNRAWENYLAYRIGVPVQKYVVAQGESVTGALLAELRQQAGLASGDASGDANGDASVNVIEGESRVVDGPQSEI